MRPLVAVPRPAGNSRSSYSRLRWTGDPEVPRSGNGAAAPVRQVGKSRRRTGAAGSAHSLPSGETRARCSAHEAQPITATNPQAVARTVMDSSHFTQVV